MFGFLVVDKPQGLTSHDVVAVVRRGISAKKNGWRVGHAGTLDPMATGVLVVCVGAATRLSEYVMASAKHYEAVIRLGIETDTYDAEGQIIAQADDSAVTALTHAQVEAALVQGEQEQVPPMYSAIKQGGKKLYDLARQGETVERPARRVTIQSQVTHFAPPEVHLSVVCSAGTYIRSIAHDLGAALGVGAHLTALRRVRSGQLDQPVAWETLQRAFVEGTWPQLMTSEHQALAHLPAVLLDSPQTEDIMHGRAILSTAHGADALAPLARAYAPDGQFIAILSKHLTFWRPAKVFSNLTNPLAPDEGDTPLFPDT